MTSLLSGGQVGISEFRGDGLTRLKVAVVGAELGEGGIIVGVVVVVCMVVAAS
jgi:hypothetical protein